jgi:hypothetical protein
MIVKEYCIVAHYGSFFVMFLFVSLEGGYSGCDKDKIRSYASLVSGVHAFRLMRLMTISIGCEVQHWTSVEPGTLGPGASVQHGSPVWEQRGGSGGVEDRYFAPITKGITSGDIRIHQNGSGKWGIRPRGVSMAETAPFLSDTDCLNASQTIIPKWARSHGWRRKVFGPEIEIRAGWETHHWHK